jgi:hypothetical protein
MSLDLHAITKLRSDADCWFLYTGPHPKRKGARRTYDGKVNWQDLRRFDALGTLAEATHGQESREMLGIMHQLRYNGLDHSPATRTRRSSRMCVKLQLVMCSDEGKEETVTDVMTCNKNSQRIGICARSERSILGSRCACLTYGCVYSWLREVYPIVTILLANAPAIHTSMCCRAPVQQKARGMWVRGAARLTMPRPGAY